MAAADEELEVVAAAAAEKELEVVIALEPTDVLVLPVETELLGPVEVVAATPILVAVLEVAVGVGTERAATGSHWSGGVCKTM